MPPRWYFQTFTFFLNQSSEYEVIIKETTKAMSKFLFRELKKAKVWRTRFISRPISKTICKRIIGKQDDDE